MIRRPRSAVVRTVAGQRLRCCYSCGEWLPEDKIMYRWREHADGWATECRDCENARRRAYYRRQREAA